MKRRERAIITFLILLFLWGTFLTGPFRFFAWMTRDLGAYLLSAMGASGDLQIFFAYGISIICMVGLFLLGRFSRRGIVSAVCAIASLCFCLFQSFGSLAQIQAIQTVPLFIAVGLVLALIAALAKTKALEDWLGDLFLLSIPVMIVYDALLAPLFSFFKLDTQILAPWIEISSTSLFMNVTLLGWPVLIWGVVVTVAALLPAVYFIGSKGK